MKREGDAIRPDLAKSPDSRNQMGASDLVSLRVKG